MPISHPPRPDPDVAGQLVAIAEQGDFSGVVGVWAEGQVIARFARGLADRANGRPNDMDTRFGVASGTKGLTALTIMSLVESGEIERGTSLRSIVGKDLPKVDPQVTIDHLLTHRSGVGDYLDEEMLGDIDDHILGEMSAHLLTTPRSYLALLNTPEQRSTPGEVFAYNNSGYVMLSLAIETLCGSFHEAVQQRVLAPASMSHSGFFRSDDLPSNCALGYLRDGRTNVLHLPVIGAGDGGAYLTLDDTQSLWRALDEDTVIGPQARAEMMSVVSARSPKNGVERPSYGRGFWMDSGANHVWLEGMDAGVSFKSGRVVSSGVQYSILSNTSAGAWPIATAIVSYAETL